METSTPSMLAGFGFCSAEQKVAAGDIQSDAWGKNGR